VVWWGAATSLLWGGRTRAADRLIERIAELAGSTGAGTSAADPGGVDLQARALIHQIHATRASTAGDLGRCLRGLESALQAFEQAADLRNACAMLTNLGYL